jgi:hypothetical protein
MGNFYFKKTKATFKTYPKNQNQQFSRKNENRPKLITC